MRQMTRRLFALIQRPAGYTLLLVLSMLLQAGSRPIVARRHQNNNMKAVIFVTIGITAFVFVMVIAYVAKKLCPRGLTFRALLELDDIHIGKVNDDEDIESGIKANIKRLTDKLTTNRKKSKKHEVQTDRDMKRRLERGDRPSEKGRDVGHAETWETSPTKSVGPTPIKNPLTTPSKSVEPSPYREGVPSAPRTKPTPTKEPEDAAEEHSEEEKEDMWKLWNTMRQDKDQKAPLLGAPPAVEAGLGAKKAIAGERSALNRGPSEQPSASAAAPNPRLLPYDSVQRPVLQSTFELSSTGKFDRPDGSATGPKPPPASSHHSVPTAQPTNNTYTYNHNTYNVVHSPPPTAKAGTAELGNHGRGGDNDRTVDSPTRKQPPVLDLSKITSPPAHVRPPPTKPPPNVTTLVRQPSTSSTAADMDRTSIKPTMRSYSPSKRPPPPAGPKPPPRPNPDAVATGTTPGLTSAVPTGGSAVSGSGPPPPSGTAVKTMKRPPPPLLAPPPGYIPGNSARLSGLRNSARGSARTDSARDTKEA